jgi:YVTN family beta-propeller protein
VGNSPADIVVNEVLNLIYVANQDDDTVSVINGSKDLGTIIGSISSGGQPHGEAFNQRTNVLYVSSVGSNTMTVVDATTNRPIGTVLVGDPNLADDFDFASHIAVNPNDNLVYVTSQDANAITVINGTTNRVIGQN